MNRNILYSILLLIFLSGCAGNYMYIKERKGKMNSFEEKYSSSLKFTPVSQEEEKEGIKISIKYIPKKELDRIFREKKIFGRLAGEDPYPKELVVFKVTLENKTESKILINPEQFVILDDLGTQYQYINPDRIKEIYESESFLYSFTKSTSSITSGVYGAPASLAQGLAGRGVKKKYALLKFIELTGGYVYPGVVYDGFIAFLQPNPKAKSIRLVIPNIKTKFDVNDEALGSVDFIFKFKCQ